MPWLVPCAAAGVMIVMLFATIYHLYRADPISSTVTTAVLLVMASFVAYARWRILPIRSRAAGTAAVRA